MKTLNKISVPKCSLQFEVYGNFLKCMLIFIKSARETTDIFTYENLQPLQSKHRFPLRNENSVVVPE